MDKVNYFKRHPSPNIIIEEPSCSSSSSFVDVRRLSASTASNKTKSVSNSSNNLNVNNFKIKTSTPTPGLKRDTIYELTETSTTLSSSYLDGNNLRYVESVDAEIEDAFEFVSNYEPKYVNSIEKRLIKQFYSNASILEAYIMSIKNVKKFLNEPDDYDCKPLYYAIKANNMAAVKLLIFHGASIRTTTRAGDPAAHLVALIGGNTDLLDYLLSFSSTLYDIDQEGWTVFHCACNQGHLHLVKYLLKKKFININAMDRKRRFTGLQLAVMNRQMEIVNYLLEYSVLKFDKRRVRYEADRIDISSQNNEGQTALHLACRYGVYDVVELLLKNYGSNIVNINQQDFKGNTCLDMAWKWLINYDVVNSNTNEKLQIFYNNKFYMQKNGLMDSSEFDNQLKLLHLLARFGAKFSSHEALLYDRNFLKAKLVVNPDEYNPLINASRSNFCVEETNEDETVTPIYNYLKCLSFILKLNLLSMFLINNPNNGNNSNKIDKNQTEIAKNNVIENLMSLKKFIQEQVYNSFEKQIYFEKVKIILIIVTNLR